MKLHKDTNGVKAPAEKKKPMVSRIRPEDIEEETNSVKNPPRRHSTARRNQWRQESAEKTPTARRKPRLQDTSQEDTKGFKTPAEKNIQQEIQEETKQQEVNTDKIG